MDKTKSRTKAEWIEYYKERIGCKDLDLFPDEQIFFHPEHGFITFFVHDDILELHNMCGDGKEWVKLAKRIMQDNELRTIRFSTTRTLKHGKENTERTYSDIFMEADIDLIKN